MTFDRPHLKGRPRPSARDASLIRSVNATNFGGSISRFRATACRRNIGVTTPGLTSGVFTVGRAGVEPATHGL